MPRLYLIDGSSYVYRAFYAIRSLATTQGLPTNAVYGFTTMLLKVLKTHEPDALAVVFDAPGRTFRDDLYTEYKATRQAAPEDLVRQLPFIREVAPAMGIETFEVPGVEADDVLGTLAVQALDKGWDVRIVTADKDFMQLVTKRAEDPQPGIVLYDDFRERIVGIDEVAEKFGVPPEQVVDVLALIGDTSDNIPGVSGIGPKFAADLVREFGSVEAILKDVSRVKPRFRAALENGRADAALSKTLATIRRDLDVVFDPVRFTRRAPDRERLAKLFGKLEFQKLLQQIDADVERTSAFDFTGYRLVLDRASLDTLACELSKAETVAFRVEVSSSDPMRAEVVGLSLCGGEGAAAYVPVGHRFLGAPPQLPLADVLEALSPVLTADRPRKVGQATAADAVVLARHGVEVRPLAFDTMVGAYLLDPDRGPFTLEAIARKFLAHDTIPAEDVTGAGKGRIAFDQVPLDRARDSSGERVEAAFRLAPVLERRVREDGLGRVLDEIEIPLLEVLADLQRNGVRVDTAYLQSIAREFERRMMAAVKDVQRLAGEEFNLDSPKQLQRILFDKLKLNPGKRTKTGFSTDVSVLERLAGQHALPSRLLEYRMLSKLKSTYVDALPALVNPDTGRIHTSYNQA
ncbi:MAG TPA: DNA polymerase, partial [Planctomycetota bacterium]|nr:DNA polymerase [Planctomycetota bacterium]